jgi:hypothetical protein
MIAMLISGLWHGAGANYLVWGALHGLGVATIVLLHRWRPPPTELEVHPLRRGLTWALTLHFVIVAWVFFRASSMSEAWAVLTAATQSWPTSSQMPSWIAVGLILVGLGTQFDGGRLRRWSIWVLRMSSMPGKTLWMTLWVYAVLVLAPAGISPFIYANY